MRKATKLESTNVVAEQIDDKMLLMVEGAQIATQEAVDLRHGVEVELPLELEHGRRGRRLPAAGAQAKPALCSDGLMRVTRRTCHCATSRCPAQPARRAAGAKLPRSHPRARTERERTIGDHGRAVKRRAEQFWRFAREAIPQRERLGLST